MALTPNTSWCITPEGDSTIIIRFKDQTTINPMINTLCHQASALLRNLKHPAITDVVPAYSTVGVFYDPTLEANSYQVITQVIQRALQDLNQDLSQSASSNASILPSGEQHIIPVCYEPEFAPDLDELSRSTGVSREELIQLHTSKPLTVFMLGFAPGLPFMGVLDEVFNQPRRSTPRTDVPAGSVAIANGQGVIYPNLSPGGWHLIGRTPVSLFNPSHEKLTLLSPGDTVRFQAINAEEFKNLQGTN